jgi:hypothetical protein
MLGILGAKEPRYYVQWVTVVSPNPVGADRLRVEPLRIRDAKTVGFPIVFEHTDMRVVRKMLTILNEG